MNRIRIKAVLIAMLSGYCSVAISSQQASSNSADIISNLRHGHFVAQLGGYQGIQGRQQHIDIPTLIGDDFSVNDRRDTNAILGVGYYIDGLEKPLLNLYYGLNVFYLAQMQVKGSVTQESLFTNLSYKYNITHLPIYAVIKSLFHTSSTKYDFILDGGIGPNFMFLRNFSEQPLNSYSVPDSPFPNTTVTRLSATLGLGVRANNIFSSNPVECGYRFFYLGNGQFDHTAQVSSSLETGNTYANAIICSVTF